ncbi:RidA family protein [Gluconacetobacter asukensis]|nr:RidA family protein [Gluconacetobacter asukensis]
MRYVAPTLLAMLFATASQAATKVKHFAPEGVPASLTSAPPFSGAVLAGDTLYIAGTTDHDPATGKPGADATAGARIVLDNIKKTVENAGLTMDDLVWVQIFASDIKDFAAFNAVYRTYFKGPMPARAFIGAGTLLGGAHFEVMGTAVKSK